MKAQRDVIFEADNEKNPTNTTTKEQNTQKWEAFQVLYMPMFLFPQPSLSLMQYTSPLIKNWAYIK